MVPIPDMKQNECPVSIIHRHPEMEVLVTEIFGMMRTHASTGASPFGPDSNKWPVKWYDAVRLAEIENIRIDDERDQVSKRMVF